MIFNSIEHMEVNVIINLINSKKKKIIIINNNNNNNNRENTIRRTINKS